MKGAKNGLKRGEEFTIGSQQFRIEAVENNLLTGFNGAIIKNITKGNLSYDETILWADGSKGFNNIFTSDNLAQTLLELGNDWVINDALGIGSGTIFPQLENLKDFANNYIALGGHIDVGIGQSMMGVGMSALAFTKGFENINFRTYSGCLSYDLLHTLEQDPDWGLNNLNGSNLQSFTNANEPVFGLIYKNATEAGSGFSNAAANKKGTATCRSYFGLVGVGNCSVNEAAKEGKIKNVTYYDVHTRNILGFKTVTVNAYGN